MKKVTIVFFVLLVGLAFFVNTLYAQDLKKAAVLDFNAYHTDYELANLVRDIIEVNLYKSGKYEIFEHDLLRLMLKEKGLSQKTVYDTYKAVRLGKMLAVDMVVIGSITKAEQYIISVKCINVKNSTVEFADTVMLKDKNRIEEAVKKIAYKATGREYREDLPTSTGYYMRGIVPGWGQIYAGHQTKGTIIMSAFVLSAAYMTYAMYHFKEKRGDYDSLSSVYDSRDEFDAKYKASEDAFRRANIAIGITGFIYLYNWVDIIFLSKPAFNRQAGFAPGIGVYAAKEVSIFVTIESPVLHESRTGIVAQFCF